MANFSTNTAVGAGGIVANALAGSAFEFIGRPSRVQIAITTVVAALGDITATIQFGPEVQLEEGIVPVEPGVGFGTMMPDHIIVDDVAAAGDRLVVRLTSAAVGGQVYVKARIIPIG